MFKKNRLAIITTLYWVLLVYIVAALVWWFIALEKQNTQMTAYRMGLLDRNDPQYPFKASAISVEKQRKTAQFIGEGGFFLALILLGAVFMYRAVRQQFTLQMQQENFMMAITHELKTPIAIARLNLETLQKHQLEDARKQKLLQMTIQETDRLDALASNILVSAQLEAGKPFPKEELDLSALVHQCIHEFRSRYADRDWRIAIDSEVDVEGDALLLRILVNNLLDNSVKYSPARTPISCSLRRSGTIAELRVADEGPGIEPSERQRIFSKFYRTGSEQIRAAKGTGLGLYLCRKIARDHGATIHVEANSPQGAAFIVRFQSA